jgi:hypothetical protein
LLIGPPFGSACRRRSRQSPPGARADDPVDLEPTVALKAPYGGLGQRAKAPIDPTRIGTRRTQLALQRPHLLRAMPAIAARTPRERNPRVQRGPGGGAGDPVGRKPAGALKAPHRGLGHRTKAPIDGAGSGAQRAQLTL